jgi:catechol 2,3-dioxygenase-like lactoylglutathione lyase family enzyme
VLGASDAVNREVAVITSAHTIIYAEDADAARAFFRDVLDFPYVDSRGGWLIFALPPGELGVHPAGDAAGSGRHELYLMCDDIAATRAELTAKGVEFTAPVSDQGWGLVTSLRVPGAGELGLYQPCHPTAYDLGR